MNLPTLAEVDEELSHRRLLRFIPRASPRYSAPIHLAELLTCIEAAVRGEPQRVVCHAPPRHAKTESVLHVPAFALRRRPELTFSYSSYGDHLSRSKSRKARALTEAAGVPLVATGLNEWRTEAGGGMLASGVGGPLIGQGIDVAFIDDPIKNRVEAESAVYRDRLGDWYRDVLRTRIEPGGSIFLFATRWHPDDLSGRLINEGFRSICLPALSETGEALWPERWPVEALTTLRSEVGEYTWASQYQGQPRPRGGRVFDGVLLFDDGPIVFRLGGGLDLAYTAKKQGDYSVAVVMAKDATGMHYLLDVMRIQVRSAQFRERWLNMAERNQCKSWRWYTSTTEQGTGDLLTHDSVQVQSITVDGDKFTRAIKYAAAWNAGKVAVRRGAPWSDQLVLEHAAFTGLNDAHDDVVDACVAAFDVLQGGSEKIDPKPREAVRMGLGAMQM